METDESSESAKWLSCHVCTGFQILLIVIYHFNSKAESQALCERDNKAVLLQALCGVVRGDGNICLFRNIYLCCLIRITINS